MMEILFVLFVLLYFFSEGATEGYTFAKKDQRTSNLLICGSILDTDSVGILDYHSWRTLELIGILGSCLTYQGDIKLLVGAVLVGYFIYERTLNYVFENKLFPKKNPYVILWLKIPRSLWYDWLAAVVGIILISI